MTLYSYDGYSFDEIEFNARARAIEHDYDEWREAQALELLDDDDMQLLEGFDNDDTFGDGTPDGFAPCLCGTLIRGAADLDDEIPF